MSLIELHGVSKSYGGKYTRTDVFKDLSLTVREGEFVAISGRSGGGKTTLLNIIGMLDFDYTGSMRFDGHDVRALSEKQYHRIRNEEIGFVFQDFKLIPDLTVFENIEVPVAFSRKRGIKDAKRQKIIDLLRDLGLEGKDRAMPRELSGGQKQRVAIARALINEPRVIIADEPTGNLDEQSSQHIMAILKDLNENRGITIILVTHDEDVKRNAGRICMLNELSAGESLI